MAITSIEEHFLNRSGRVNYTRGRTLVRAYKVRTDTNMLNDPDVVAQAGPSIGDTFPNRPGILCLDKTARPTSSDGLHWMLEVEYGVPDQSAQDPQQDPEQPWENEPAVSFDFVSIQEAFGFCYQVVKDGQTISTNAEPTLPVVNSAGVPYDPPLVDGIELMTITITRNERVVSPATIYAVQNSLNAHQVRVAGVNIGSYVGRMRKIRPVKRFTPFGVRYWEVTYDILLDPRTHFRSVLDAGMMYKENGDLINFKDADGQEARDPQLLDGEGAPLESGDPPVSFQYRLQKSTSWGSLRLPTNHSG